MKLLAGSLSVEVDEFLHAGYLSAYPRSFADMGSYYLGEKAGEVEVIDVTQAVALKTPADEAGQAAEAPAAIASSPPPLAPASITLSDLRTGFLLAVVFLFFTFLISVYMRRIRKANRPGWWPWLVAGVPMLFLVGIYYVAYPGYEEHRLNHLPPPWRGVAVQQYQDPEAATRVLLHGLVAGALAGCPVDVENLAAIQREVAFPVPADRYTPGMQYAVRTYGRDGWGREFFLESLDEGRYRIASAGPDGTHGTPDDVVLVTPGQDEDDWEQLVKGFYVRRVEGEFACFVHRVGHDNFLPSNAGKARTATETDLFDVLHFGEMFQDHRPEERPHPVLARLEEDPDYVRRDETADRLLFVQIGDANDG